MGCKIFCMHCCKSPPFPKGDLGGFGGYRTKSIPCTDRDVVIAPVANICCGAKQAQFAITNRSHKLRLIESSELDLVDDGDDD